MSSIIYIMGVSGSGKTTIGQRLSLATGIPFFDGDDFHSKANKDKMQAGIPLNDDDRKDWLLSINEMAREESKKKGAIIACSALKEKYRLLLADKLQASVYWIFLQGNYELIRERMKARKDHFMPGSLLQSQFDALEVPANAMVVDIGEDAGLITAAIVKELGL